MNTSAVPSARPSDEAPRVSEAPRAAWAASRGRWAPLGALVLGLVGLFLFLTLVAGARFDAATVGLVLAAGGLLFTLRALFNLVQAVTQPQVARELRDEADLFARGQRELQEERRRLLRAIHELQFDFQMGKLSEADYKQVRQTYELKAIEVMRALQRDDGDFDPELRKELMRRGIAVGADGNEPPRSPSEPAAGDAEVVREAEPAAGEAEVVREAEPAAGEAEVVPKTEPGEVAAAVQGELAGALGAVGASKPAGRAESTGAPESSVRTCPGCQGSNDADAKFCKHCGAALT